MAFAVFMVTTVVYSLWASGDTQPWNEPHLMNEVKGSVENGAYEHDENDDLTLKMKKKEEILEGEAKRTN